MPVQGPIGRPNQRVRPNRPEKQTVKRRVSRSRSLPNQPLRLAGHVYKSRIRILRLALCHSRGIIFGADDVTGRMMLVPPAIQ